MPVTEQEIRRLGDYVGATPAPADFDAFWSKRMAEADQVPLDFAVTPSEIPPFHTCEYLDLWFRGMGGAQLYAKYVKTQSGPPGSIGPPVPWLPRGQPKLAGAVLLCGHGLCAAGHGLPRPGAVSYTHLTLPTIA